MLFVCEDNGIGISVKTPDGWIGSRFGAMPGLDYFHADGLDGAKAFALWPLDQASEATFGTPQWPIDRPVPQAWIELEVSSPEAVAHTAERLREAGQEILVDAHQEPWGQTTARLLSPEGLLVGISYLPDYHREDAGSP